MRLASFLIKPKPGCAFLSIRGSVDADMNNIVAFAQSEKRWLAHWAGIPGAGEVFWEGVNPMDLPLCTDAVVQSLLV